MRAQSVFDKTLQLLRKNKMVKNITSKLKKQKQ